MLLFGCYFISFSFHLTISLPFFFFLIPPLSFQEDNVKPPNLTSQQTCQSSVTQAPSRGPAVSQRGPPCSVAMDHQVALPVSQRKPCVSSALYLQPESVQSREKSLSDKAPRVHVEVPQPSRGNPRAQETQFRSQRNVTPEFIPVFKKRSLEMNRNVLEPGNLKRKEHVTESKLFSFKTSVIQNDKLNLEPARKKIASHHTPMNAKHLNPKTSRAEQEKNTESYQNTTIYPPCSGKSSPASRKGSKQRSHSLGFQMSGDNLGVITSAADFQVNGKEHLTSKYIAHILGKGHESPKVERQPHMFESDTEMENGQLLQHHSVNLTNEADGNDQRLIVSRTAHRSKTKLCQGSSETSKKPHSRNIHYGQPSPSRNQVKQNSFNLRVFII